MTNVQPSHRVKMLLTVAGLLTGFMFSTAAGVAAQGTDSRTSIRRPMIVGTYTDAAGGRGAFSGNLDLVRFAVRQQFIVVIGNLTGVLAESSGVVVGRVNEPVEFPVVVVTGTCELLHLDIGPLDLEVRGILVHFEKDALGITVQNGPDRSLLCSTAKLLASQPSHETVATQLNTVLSVLVSQ